jgi:hypothetical protein
VLKTNWVTVHDTAVDGTAPFNANTAAKNAHATPSSDPRTASSGRARAAASSTSTRRATRTRRARRTTTPAAEARS